MADWKESATGPSDVLERRIVAALADEGLIDSVSAQRALRRPDRKTATTWAWIAAAAAVILGMTVLIQRPWLETGGDSYEAAVLQVEQAQHDYAKAIAGLERQAGEVLARADNPALDSQDAALLLNYRDRLTHLDSVIAEVQSFLDENPGHARGHTVLLAAYEEKDQLLREILDLAPGERS